jgi:hypothetical protein
MNSRTPKVVSSILQHDLEVALLPLQDWCCFGYRRRFADWCGWKHNYVALITKYRLSTLLRILDISGVLFEVLGRSEQVRRSHKRRVSALCSQYALFGKKRTTFC